MFYQVSHLFHIYNPIQLQFCLQSTVEVRKACLIILRGVINQKIATNSEER